MKTAPSLKNRFKKVRRTLSNNNSKINVSDYGKGSLIFKSNYRKVSKIAKVAGISNKKAYLLIRVVSYFKSTNIMEIGTSLGLSTSAMTLGNNNAKITTLEGCKNTAKVAQELFHTHHFENIQINVGKFEDSLPTVLNNKLYDLIYFDGNHQKEATLHYFEQCLNCIHNDSVFIFDDINWSPEMQETWEEIKKHPKVKVTINTYFWGIVFFRQEQQKEHFTIRV